METKRAVALGAWPISGCRPALRCLSPAPADRPVLTSFGQADKEGTVFCPCALRRCLCRVALSPLAVASVTSQEEVGGSRELLSNLGVSLSPAEHSPEWPLVAQSRSPHGEEGENSPRWVKSLRWHRQYETDSEPYHTPWHSDVSVQGYF
uniref:Uncharacterized protein n=1 Tax=Myotis myotis TaxID=51298 RepID=A0A7J7RUN1_MYOMY|nr:hypothetical protein mMyoMyo1_010151 [Myotis myotis]